MTDLRASILADEELVASRMRFGLFSQPPPLAIGDDSKYSKPEVKRGQNGKPVTEPPQMLAGTCRTGMLKSSYFQVPGSVLQNDPYKEAFQLDLQYERKMHSKAKFHQHDFKPASGPKALNKSAYRYVEENPQRNKKKIIKDDSGRVKTEPRNFSTNPTSKVESEFFKPSKYIADPYDRKAELEKKERQIFRSKLQEATFKTMNPSGRMFGKNSAIYGDDDITKKMQQTRQQRVKTAFNPYPHEAQFKPAMKTSCDTIGKFPEYIAPKAQQGLPPQKVKKEGKQEKQTWRPNSFSMSRPTPSISLNHKNLPLRRPK